MMEMAHVAHIMGIHVAVIVIIAAATTTTVEHVHAHGIFIVTTGTEKRLQMSHVDVLHGHVMRHHAMAVAIHVHIERLHEVAAEWQWRHAGGEHERVT